MAIENRYALMVNVHLPPHYHSVMHTHQDLAGVMIALGDGPYILTGEDGVAQERRQKEGAVAYREAGRPGLATKHQVENRGETPVRAVRVELKEYPPFYEVELQPLKSDSRYSVEIDNQRVRVLRIRLGPRETLPGMSLGPHVVLDLTDSGTQHEANRAG